MHLNLPDTKSLATYNARRLLLHHQGLTWVYLAKIGNFIPRLRPIYSYLTCDECYGHGISYESTKCSKRIVFDNASPNLIKLFHILTACGKQYKLVY